LCILPLEIQSTKFDQKSDRCVRMLVSRNHSRNELVEINELKECMAKAPLNIREPKEFKPLTKVRYRMVLHIFAIGANVSIQEEVADAVKNVVAQTHTPLSRALTVRLVAALKVVDKSDARPGSDSTRWVAV
jgi:hypothetical protein